MHKATLLSLAAIAISSLLISPVATMYEDSGVKDIMLNMDISLEEMEAALRERETQIFGSQRVDGKQDEEFFASFAYGDRINEESREPKNSEELKIKVSALANLYEGELKAQNTKNFFNAAKVHVKIFLINEILINDKSVNKQDLVVNMQTTVVHVRNIIRDIKASFYEPLSEQLKENVDDIALNIITVAQPLTDMFYTLATEREKDICANLENSDMNVMVNEHIRFLDIYHAVLTTELDSGKGEIFSDVLARFAINENRYDSSCIEFYKNLLISLYESLKDGENLSDIISGVFKGIGLTYGQDHTLSSFRAYFDFLNLRRQGDSLYLKDEHKMSEAPEAVRLTHAMYVLEYIYYGVTIDGEQLDLTENIDEEMFINLLSIMDIILGITNSNPGAIIKNIKVFNNTSFVGGEGNFGQAINFHNLSLQMRSLYYKLKNGKQVLKNLDTYIDRLYKDDLTAEERAKQVEMEKPFPVNISENYGFMKGMIFAGNQKYPVKFSMDRAASDQFVEKLNDFNYLYKFFNSYIAKKMAENENLEVINADSFYKHIIEENIDLTYKPAIYANDSESSGENSDSDSG